MSAFAFESTFRVALSAMAAMRLEILECDMLQEYCAGALNYQGFQALRSVTLTPKLPRVDICR
jgi:hypothetical protein